MSGQSRRKLLKFIVAGGGAVVAGKSLPESWSRPIVDSVMLPAHAQTSLSALALIRQWASSADGSSEYNPGDPRWNFIEATNAPDTSDCGDIGTAHAFQSQSGSGHWLLVSFGSPVIPTLIDIYITYNPGQITSVDLYSGGSFVITVPGSAHSVSPTICDASGESPVIFSLDVEGLTSTCIDGVRMNVDQNIASDWHEVDAVELVGYAC